MHSLTCYSDNRINTLLELTLAAILSVYYVSQLSTMTTLLTLQRLHFKVIMPPPRRGGGGIKRSSASVVRLSDVAYIGSNSKTKRPRKTKLHRGTPGHMRLPHRLQGQKVKSQGHRAGAYCGGHLATQLVSKALLLHFSLVILRSCMVCQVIG